MFLLIQRRHGFLNLKSHCLELYIFFTISVRVHSGRITSVCVLWECIVYIYIEREREREWLCISDGMLTDIVKEIYIYTAGSWEEQIFQLGEIKKSRNGWNLCSTMGEIKKKLELKSMSWSPWEWTETHVSLIASDLDALGVMPWPFVMELKAGAHTHMHTHTHTHTHARLRRCRRWRRIMVKAEQSVAQPLPHTGEGGNRWVTTCASYKMSAASFLPSKSLQTLSCVPR